LTFAGGTPTLKFVTWWYNENKGWKPLPYFIGLCDEQLQSHNTLLSSVGWYKSSRANNASLNHFSHTRCRH